MKILKVDEEDVLTVLCNILAEMKSETDNINKVRGNAQISQDDIFDALEDAIEIEIEICEN